jgi:phosphonatase-like hydrolase
MIGGIELVVFDMAGTTVHDDGAVRRCLRSALVGAGVRVSDQAVDAVMGLAKPEAIARLLGPIGLGGNPAGRIDAIHRDFVARSTAFYRDDPSVREISAASQVFQSLRECGVRVALDTGFNRVITQAILDRLGWSDTRLVDATICSDEVARGRPFPDMILALLSRLRIAGPERAAKVGDTPADLEEGTNAGCGLVIGVTTGTCARATLARYPHTHLIGTINELPDLLWRLSESTPGRA